MTIVIVAEKGQKQPMFRSIEQTELICTKCNSHSRGAQDYRVLDEFKRVYKGSGEGATELPPEDAYG